MDSLFSLLIEYYVPFESIQLSLPILYDVMEGSE